MTPLTELIGWLLGLFGVGIALIGQVFYTMYDERIWAMKAWRFSNAMMCIWFVGLGFEMWNGVFTSLVYAGLYGLYWLTNEYGLRRLQ